MVGAGDAAGGRGKPEPAGGVVSLAAEDRAPSPGAARDAADRAVWALNDLLFRAEGLLHAARDLLEAGPGDPPPGRGLRAVLDETALILGQGRASVADLLAATGAEKRPPADLDPD